MSETASRAPGEGLPKGSGADITPDESAHDWRQAFQHQLKVSIVVISGLIALVGSLVLAIDLTALHGESKTVVLEVAVSLILFGTTTLFITVAVAASLETRMEASIKQILKGEGREISNLAATVRDMLDSERDEILKLNKATQDAVHATQADLKPLGGKWLTLGLTNVYLTRSDALAEFGEHIRAELLSAEAAKAEDSGVTAKDGAIPDGRADAETEQPETERPRLWIAASSMKGLLEAAGKEFDGLGIFNWAAKLAASRKLDLRIMMTHPDFAMLRAGQEDRGENAIPEEIREAVNHLRRENVPPERVKMIAATPTVFAIATRDQMLLNPYPYSQEAYRSFTLTVRRSRTKREVESIDSDIFEQYERRHFLMPWDSDRALRLGDLYEIPLRPDTATPPPGSARTRLRSASGAG